MKNNLDMKSNSHIWLKIYFFLAWLESLVTLFVLIRIPPDLKNAWIFGFSRSRLSLILSIVLVSLVLAWFLIHFLLKTASSEHFVHAIRGFFDRKNNYWAATLIWVLIIVFCGWILSLKWFTASDQQISAILQRLTPVVVFTILICVQSCLVSGFLFIVSEREWWIYLVIIVGGTVLFSWMSVGSFILANNLFPDYYVNERYGDTFQVWMPYILFQTTIFIQLPTFLRSKIGVSFDNRWILLLILGLSGLFYYQAVINHGLEINVDKSHSDQNAFVNFTMNVKESGFTYTGDRNRVPGYPFLQALFCGGRGSEEMVFECGKRVNIYLSMLGLAVVLWVGSIYLPFEHAATLTLLAGFSLFIFKAGYFTVEIAYYLVSFLGFVLLGRMLLRPSPTLGLGTGLVLGIAQMLKASVLPGLVLFILIYLVYQFYILYRKWKIVNSENRSKEILINFLSLGLLLLAFFGVLFPYIRESKEIYGNYFYNVNSHFYVWLDSWDQAKQSEVSYYLDAGLTDLPPDQIPGLRKYLHEHDLPQITGRLWDGLLRQMGYVLHPYSTVNYTLIYLSLLVLLFILNRDRVKLMLIQYLPVILFVLFYFCGYLLLFAWYTPIAKGPRFVYGLFLPFLFSIFIALHEITRDADIKQAGLLISGRRLLEAIHLVTIGILIFDAYLVISQVLPNGYFGS